MTVQQSGLEPRLVSYFGAAVFCPPSHPLARQPLHNPIGQDGCLSVHCTPPPNSLSGRRVLGRRSLWLGAGSRRWKAQRPLHRSGTGLERGGIPRSSCSRCLTWSGKRVFLPGRLPHLFFPARGCLLGLSGFEALVRAVKPPTVASPPVGSSCPARSQGAGCWQVPWCTPRITPTSLSTELMELMSLTLRP